MQGSSYAPLQFLRSPWNRDVYTAIDNQVDGRTTLVLYLGSASTLPSELQKYNIGCILIHKDEKQIYLNTGNETTPTWVAFGPGTNTLPTPFVAGQYLTNDGVDAFWSLIDLATGVTGLLDSDHIDLSDLANNSDFIDFLIANSYFTSSLANDSNFLTNLTSNLNTSGLLTVAVDGITITGDGTAGNPLVATAGSFSLDIQENGVSIENQTDTINFVTNGGIVSTPLAGVVDVDLTALLAGSGGTKIEIDPTQKTATNNSQTYTIAIPGGILSTDNAIRFELPISSLAFTSNSFVTIAATYGGTSIGSVSIGNPSTSSGAGGAIYKGVIMATGATNTQKGAVVFTGTVTKNISGAFEMQNIDSATANSAVDSTVNQNLVITITSNDTAATIVTEGVIVEKISGQVTPNAVVERISNVPSGDKKLLFIGNYLLQFNAAALVSQYFLYERDAITNQYRGVGTVTINLAAMPVTYTGNAVLSTDGTKLYAKTLSSGNSRLAAIVEVNITTGALLTTPCMIDATYFTNPTKDYFISGGKAYMQEQNAPYAWGECTYTAATSQTLGVTTFTIGTTGTVATFQYPILNTLGDFVLYNEENTGVANFSLNKVEVSTNTITRYTYCPTNTIADGAVVIGTTIAVARVLTRGIEYDIEIVYISN